MCVLAIEALLRLSVCMLVLAFTGQWSLMLLVEKLHELDLMFSYIFFFRLLDAGSSSSSTGTLLFLKHIGSND